MSDPAGIGQAGVRLSGVPVVGMRSAALSLTPTATSGHPRSKTASLGMRSSPRFVNMLARSIGARAPLSCTGNDSASGGPAAGSVAGVPPFADVLSKVGRKVGVDPTLLAAVVEAESGYNPRAVSRAGAKGLMQLMDPTARSQGVANPFDPEQSLLGGARCLRGLLDRYGGSLSLALAAYNAGPGAVDRYGGIPPFAETQAYVPRVLAAQRRYQKSAWGQAQAVPA